MLKSFCATESQLRRKQISIVISFIIAKQRAIFRAHFASLKMHRAHAHRKLLPKWVPHAHRTSASCSRTSQVMLCKLIKNIPIGQACYCVRIVLGQFDEVFLNLQFGAVPVQLSNKRSFPRLFWTFFSNINNNIIK